MLAAGASAEPLVSIVIPNRDGNAWLPACLRSIGEQTHPAIETLIVDNGSRARPDEVPEARAERVRCLELGSNHGYGGAANAGAAAAAGDVLFFLNNDTVLAPDAVTALVRALAETGAALVAPRIVDYDGRGRGSCGMALDVFGYPRGRRDGDPLFYADGAAFAIRRDAFEGLGGFDASYFLFYEDADLSWRAWLAGYSVAAAPEAVVRHYGGGSLEGGHPHGTGIRTQPSRRYLGERNRLRNLLKNYAGHTLVWALPGYLAITVAAMVTLAATRRWRLAAAYPRAYAANVAGLRDTLRKRRAVQAQRRIGDRAILARMFKGSEELVLLRGSGVPHVLAR